jgi:hypothetical protein
VQRIKRPAPITPARIRQSTVKQFALNFDDGNITSRIYYNGEETRDQCCHKYVDTPRLLLLSFVSSSPSPFACGASNSVKARSISTTP